VCLSRRDDRTGQPNPPGRRRCWSGRCVFQFQVGVTKEREIGCSVVKTKRGTGGYSGRWGQKLLFQYVGICYACRERFWLKEKAGLMLWNYAAAVLRASRGNITSIFFRFVWCRNSTLRQILFPHPFGNQRGRCRLNRCVLLLILDFVRVDKIGLRSRYAAISKYIGKTTAVQPNTGEDCSFVKIWKRTLHLSCVCRKG